MIETFRNADARMVRMVHTRVNSIYLHDSCFIETNNMHPCKRHVFSSLPMPEEVVIAMIINNVEKLNYPKIVCFLGKKYFS